jgi:hypothetical protein
LPGTTDDQVCLPEIGKTTFGVIFRHFRRCGRAPLLKVAERRSCGTFTVGATVARRLLVVKIRRFESARQLASRRFLAIFAGTKRQILSTRRSRFCRMREVQITLSVMPIEKTQQTLSGPFTGTIPIAPPQLPHRAFLSGSGPLDPLSQPRSGIRRDGMYSTSMLMPFPLRGFAV